MFKERTVFVLGAGASWHYGYPTGGELLRMVGTSADRLVELTRERFMSGAWQSLAFETARDIGHGFRDAGPVYERTDAATRRLSLTIENTNIPVIDHVLAKASAIESVGRLCIADAIMNTRAHYQEARTTIRDAPFPDNHDWIRHVVHPLTSGTTDPEDLVSETNNPVYFVTFNYDRSLERRLARAFRAVDGFD